jgi:hypothetical protein
MVCLTMALAFTGSKSSHGSRQKDKESSFKKRFSTMMIDGAIIQ